VRFGSDENEGAGSEAANAMHFSYGGNFSETLPVPSLKPPLRSGRMLLLKAEEIVPVLLSHLFCEMQMESKQLQLPGKHFLS